MKMSAEESVYSSPAIQLPTVAKLRPLADKLGFDLTDAQLQDYAGILVQVIEIMYLYSVE